MADPIEVSFVVPGAPKGKEHQGARIVKTKDGRQFISHYTKSQTRSEEGAIRHFACLAMQGRLPLDGPLEIRVCAWIAIPGSWSTKKQTAAASGEIYPVGRPDWDNYAEMLDALNGIVWTDDARVVTAVVHKRYSVRPRLVVHVRPIELRAAPCEGA